MRIAFLFCVVGLSACQDHWPRISGSPPLSETLGIAMSLPTDALTYDAEADQIAALGARWIRFDLPWAAIEKTKGVYDMTAFDPAIDALIQRGLRPLPILGAGNTLYSAAGAAANDAAYPPDTPEPFGSYVSYVVQHLRGRVDTYEVWNEPNVGFRFFKPQADPVKYAGLLATASQAAHAACPGCTLLPSGVYYNGGPLGTPLGIPFMTQVLGIAGTGIVDGVAVHPYMLYPPCSPPESSRLQPCQILNQTETPLPTMLDQTIAMAPGKPLYITEVGWPTVAAGSLGGPVTPDDQAAWLARTLIFAASRGSQVTALYTIRDGPNFAQFPPEDAFGLIAYDPDVTHAPPKAAYLAIQALIAEIGALPYAADRSTEAGTGGFAFVFADAHYAVTVAWAVEGSEHVASFSRLGHHLRVGALGQPLVAAGSTTVSLSGMPTLLQEER